MLVLDHQKKCSWKCKNGHRFQATVSNRTGAVNRQPTGCAACNGTKRITDEELLAKATLYLNKKELYTKESSTYQLLVKRNLLDLACLHMTPDALARSRARSQELMSLPEGAERPHKKSDTGRALEQMSDRRSSTEMKENLKLLKRKHPLWFSREERNKKISRNHIQKQYTASIS